MTDAPIPRTDDAPVPGYSVLPARAQEMLESPAYRVWETADGQVVAEFYRLGGSVLFRLPGFADFEIPAGPGPVLCRPIPEVSRASLDHAFSNQVLPLLLARSGRLCFHGSAALLGGGVAAFLGASRRGKSTLATSFALSGHPLMTDDGVVILAERGRYLVEPNRASVRLWEDSRNALVPAELAAVPVAPHTTKLKLVSGPDIPFCRSARPLAAAFFLGTAKVESPRIAPLRGAAILEAWVRHSFLLDIDDPAALGRHFEELAAFCHAVPCYALDYPRDYGRLNEVRAAVLAQLEKNGETA